MKDRLTDVASLDAFVEAVTTCKHPKLFLVDIKRFKAITIAHGDEGGDFILRRFAQTLQTFALSHEMTLYRFVDDTFLLLQNAPFELSKMENLIFALLDTLKNLAYDYNDQTIRVETVIGISFDHFNALEKAQKALRVAKTEDQPFVTYSEFANTLLSESEEAVEAMMKQAIERENITLHCQAVVDLSEQACYYEGLLRLCDRQTLQSPKLFLKIAHERGLYDALFRSIVHKACQLTQAAHHRIALNLPYEDLLDAERLAFLRHRVDPKNVWLEVECEGKTPCESLLKSLSTLKQEGFTLILDNVKSAEYLAYFPQGCVDYVKLHGRLIRDFAIDPNAQTTCNAMIDLARKQGIQTIASQLNSRAAREIARNLGCDLFQGFIVEQPHDIA
ncbi:EAL domain-containing protein [Sulfurospirillum sp. hDNRA2]|uniref:EAL domain-containing protein n=1 Tax=Sulfurospirillum sp. hDNRA2 TaxID=3237298 RepID=UPI0020B70DE6|nr:EAL domain-containing protein [Sulfurospirillum sp. DNRA8]MCP3653043.1 EAL domain-containing protein [Sulfurospirillum sp. DNRA8]MCR1811894.1 EAL domain-containing protein [Sulfurospirillum sp. DNRA8]